MNELPETTDLQKLYDAVQCIRKTVRCTICQKLPTEPKAGKCGHPFCKNCGEKILRSKKAVCSICKTVIIRSAVHNVSSIDNMVRDLSSLCAAIEKDSDTIIRLDKPQGIKQYQGKRKSLTLPGPSISTIDQEGSSRSDLSRGNVAQQNKGRKSNAKRVDRQESTDSEQTVKILNKTPAKMSGPPSLAIPSTSRTNNVVPEPVFTSDNLSIKIGAIGYKEKVEGWLNSEEFEDDSKTEPEIEKPPSSDSPTISDVLESFSQVKQNSRESSESRRNSQASKTPRKNGRSRGSLSTPDTERKFKSFTFGATDKPRQSAKAVPKAVTPAEKMFDELKQKTLEGQSDNKKSRGPSVSTDSSWSELARLKKEAQPKVKKRRRLNVSLERPSSAKPVVESFDREDSEEEKEPRDISGLVDGKNKSAELNEKTLASEGSAKKRQKPSLLSYRTLEPSEMLDLSTLNKRQVKEIIGVFDVSKNSSNSPDKSPVKSNRDKLSLRRSGERSRDSAIEEEITSHLGGNSRPQSKQSFHADDSRPGSRLSYKSIDKPPAEKFRLSTGRRSTTPNVGLLETNLGPNLTQRREEEQDKKLQLGSDSPVRVCNDFMRNKLSLKRTSGGSKPAQEKTISTNIPIKKLGKLHKVRPRIRFLRLGAIRSKQEETEFVIETRDVSTQTSPLLFNTDSTLKYAKRQHSRNETVGGIIIPETRTVSAASIDSRQITEAQAASSSNKTATVQESPDEFDTINKVNMLSPEKDSQLKFLATKSPSVPRMSFAASEDPVQSVGKSCTLAKETSFSNFSAGTSGPEEYLRAVKKCAEKLIVTDSEDQDTPDESFRKIKRRHNQEAVKNGSEKLLSSATSLVSKTASDLGMSDKRESVDKSPSLKSVGNNSVGNLSRASSRRKRNSKDSLESQVKRQDTGKLKSKSRCEQTMDSDAETVLLEQAKNKDVVRQLEDSEASTIAAKHKVVRKLKYSQESGSNANTGSGRSASLEEQAGKDKEKKSSNPPEKKTFQRIRRVSSTDSEELLEISLTTKQSSSNSQTIQRPGLSREVNKSPIPSEDMTVVFSSNKDTQESKRKRSPSPNSLDNHDLQAIASNWCADLDHSSEEIVPDSDKVLGFAKERSSIGTAQKKPRVEVQNSSASLSIDNFPVLSPTAIYGKTGKETTAEIIGKSSMNEEFDSIEDLDKAAAQFDGIDGQTRTEKSKLLSSEANSVPKSNTRHVDLAGNTECSIKRGNTFGGMVTTTRSMTPTKAKSLQSKDLALIHRQSQNSDKENELGSQGVKKRENRGVLSNTGQKVVCDEDSNELLADSKSDKSQAVDTPKTNPKNVPSKSNSTNNTELFESSFDRDYLNITQEQLLMQEVEENLLGRKSKDITKTKSQETRQRNLASKSPNKNKDKSSSGVSAACSVQQKAKGYQIAQIDSDDSETMDEDIIESTPEKPLKKDLHAQTENSQRYNISPKSFMSQDMTPISKTFSKHSQMRSEVSMLSEPGSKPLSSNHSSSKNPSAGPSCHSTPKPAPLVSRKSNLQGESEGLETPKKENRKLCFVCSYLTLQEVQVVKAFARKHNVEYTATYKPEVTHVIVETNDRDSAGRTLKYLLGVAHKKWIVSFRWVVDSMSQNKILDEADYEAIDSDTEEPGPRRSRLSTKGLFDEFAFVFMKPFSDITIEQLQDLITSTGGTVFETLEDLASVENKHKLILYNSDIHESAVLDNWRKRGRAMPVQVEWVLSCISQYELVSLCYYLQDADIKSLSEMGFPDKLIADDEDSYSVDEPSTTSNTA